MLPKKVKKRASLLAVFLSASVFGVFLILNALNKNILYFNSPTDIKISQDINFDKKIRVGGMVKKDSLIIKEEEIKFIITDFNNELNISFSGTVPNLFSEEKDGDEVIHRGISQRSFARSFTIADDVKVNGAELKDGLLTISCEKIVPEIKKKRLIEIK